MDSRRRGGCWNDNDVDDSPGDPTEDPNTGGEGGDCSGFTFKVWREAEYGGDAGGYLWNKLRKVHGPYTADRFKAGYGAPNVTYYKSGLIRMDALASSSHIGMIYSHNAGGSHQMGQPAYRQPGMRSPARARAPRVYQRDNKGAGASARA